MGSLLTFLGNDFFRPLFLALKPSLLVVYGFAKKVNFAILIPVFAITAAFISGMIDSGFFDRALGFVVHHLEMLHAYAYKCGRLFGNVSVEEFVRCFGE